MTLTPTRVTADSDEGGLASLGSAGMSVLAIDAGTTGVTSLVVDEVGRVVARGYREIPVDFPRAGYVEQSLDDIWAATLAAVVDSLERANETPTCIGITNQRETVGVWDARTLKGLCPAIVWQDRRTSDSCASLIESGQAAAITDSSGLRVDPYFSATKLQWIAQHNPDVWAAVIDGSARVGTIDTFLVARLTGGSHQVTDMTNASRTMLFDLDRLRWSRGLCDLFDVPVEALAEVVPSFGVIARTDPDSFLGRDLPITGIAGDQEAALVGQACFTEGDTKCTYGTGAFVLQSTGTRRPTPGKELLATVALGMPDGTATYALEGSVFVAGAAVQWLRDGLGLIETAQDMEPLARTVPDSDGVVFVPALTGLGAPQWDPRARGTVMGLTRGTAAGHIARATLDAIAFSVGDVLDAMCRHSGARLESLSVDGGAAANNLLCEIQADVAGVPIRRMTNKESTGMGAAYLAGVGGGVWSSLEEATSHRVIEREFAPQGEDPRTKARWADAVAVARSWEPDASVGATD